MDLLHVKTCSLWVENYPKIFLLTFIRSGIVNIKRHVKNQTSPLKYFWYQFACFKTKFDILIKLNVKFAARFFGLQNRYYVLVVVGFFLSYFSCIIQTLWQLEPSSFVENYDSMCLNIFYFRTSLFSKSCDLSYWRYMDLGCINDEIKYFRFGYIRSNYKFEINNVKCVCRVEGVTLLRQQTVTVVEYFKIAGI